MKRVLLSKKLHEAEEQLRDVNRQLVASSTCRFSSSVPHLLAHKELSRSSLSQNYNSILPLDEHLFACPVTLSLEHSPESLASRSPSNAVPLQIHDKLRTLSSCNQRLTSILQRTFFHRFIGSDPVLGFRNSLFDSIQDSQARLDGAS